MTPAARRSAVSGPSRALRARREPDPSDDGLAAGIREEALGLQVLGWVRGDAPPEGPVEIHAEGAPEARSAFLAALERHGPVLSEQLRVEGHEQFQIRGAYAGVFVVQEHQASP